ncbi:hypothetical protein [Bifidobacterium moraviense]|uniref:hypothetical protein n=1 Tax=Bifidobacterium moraviense TaxID=2675323 RepID=UPI00145C888F|nr:hypothetical protein [Bifidobacterium sp. DSM 109958]
MQMNTMPCQLKIMMKPICSATCMPRTRNSPSSIIGDATSACETTNASSAARPAASSGPTAEAAAPPAPHGANAHACRRGSGFASLMSAIDAGSSGADATPSAQRPATRAT